MPSLHLSESGLRSWSKSGKTRRSKCICIYGQRKAYMTLRKCHVIEDGELKTKSYRRLTYIY